MNLALIILTSTVLCFLFKYVRYRLSTLVMVFAWLVSTVMS